MAVDGIVSCTRVESVDFHKAHLFQETYIRNEVGLA
jgi:hypothetical protein